MFKAKLIENDNYYKLRSRQMLLILLPSIPIGLLVNFYTIPVWLSMVMIGIYLLAIILIARNQKIMCSFLGNKFIEIDEHEIRIISKKGSQQEIIKLDEVEKLILNDEYSIPFETMKEIGKEITGKSRQNNLLVQQNNKKRKLDFELDSYYMITQLSKIIEKWKAKGYIIERANLK